MVLLTVSIHVLDPGLGDLPFSQHLSSEPASSESQKLPQDHRSPWRKPTNSLASTHRGFPRFSWHKLDPELNESPSEGVCPTAL